MIFKKIDNMESVEAICYYFSMNSSLVFDNRLVYIPELLEYPFQSRALRRFSKLI